MKITDMKIPQLRGYNPIPNWTDEIKGSIVFTPEKYTQTTTPDGRKVFTEKEAIPSVNPGDFVTVTNKFGVATQYLVIYIRSYPDKTNLTLEKVNFPAPEYMYVEHS